MIRIAICDDEPRVREHLQQLIESNMNADIRQFDEGGSLLEQIEDYDILLLDICMNDSEYGLEMNGIEIAKKIRESSQIVIIFITALQEYACQAFDVEAFHYLLKPVDEEKFLEVLKRAVKQTEEKKYKEPLTIKSGGGYYSIPVEQIFYAESDGRKIILHTGNGNYTFYEKMSTLEKRLGSSFFRSHRGYLVALGAVAAYDGADITMKNGETVFLAKQKYGKFVEAFMEYLGKRV